LNLSKEKVEFTVLRKNFYSLFVMLVMKLGHFLCLMRYPLANTYLYVVDF
jgi:hypothetical protein